MEFLRNLLFIMFIYFSSYLMEKSNFFLALLLLGWTLVYFYDKNSRRINLEIDWISDCLLGNYEIEEFKKRRILYEVAQRALFDKKITKGISIKEFSEVLLKYLSIKQIDDRKRIFTDYLLGLPEKIYSREENVAEKSLIFVGYGCSFPTPELTFKFRNGKLIKIIDRFINDRTVDSFIDCF